MNDERTTAEKLPVKRLYRAQMLARTGDMV